MLSLSLKGQPPCPGWCEGKRRPGQPLHPGWALQGREMRVRATQVIVNLLVHVSVSRLGKCLMKWQMSRFFLLYQAYIPALQ